MLQSSFTVKCFIDFYQDVRAPEEYDISTMAGSMLVKSDGSDVPKIMEKIKEIQTGKYY